MRLIVTEKAMMSHRLIPFVLKKWPKEEIVFIETMGITGIRFKYPRDIPYSDFPHVREPEFKNVDYNELYFNDPAAPYFHFCSGHTIDKNGTPTRSKFTQEEVKKLLHEAEHIVCAVDPDERGFFSFHLYLNQFCPQRVSEEHEALFISGGLSDECIQRYLDYPITTNADKIKALLEKAQIKRYFEYNYNLNAMAIFRKPFDLAFGAGKQLQMSKYELQCLYYLSEQPGATLNEDILAFNMERRWKGTGKYTHDTKIELGSPSSRRNIVGNLNEVGAFCFSDDKKMVAVSNKGLRFLSMLHPDTRDPDLPYRIKKWQDEGLESAKGKIDRYLKTFFGKQKRFNNKIKPQISQPLIVQ